MKHYLIAALTVILMAGTASAQEFNIGIKGGLNAYSVDHDYHPRGNYKTGFHAGLMGHVHLSQRLAIQPEVVYSTQGAHYRDNNWNTRFNLDYINVPFLFQFMFGDGFRLQAGPQMGFLINAKSINDNGSINHKNDLKAFDFGATVGISYIHKSNFGIDARYNHGLTNIYENNSTYATNRGFQVGLFYLFKHKS